MKNNNKWISLVIAIGITLVMSLLALYILEYMIPFSKNTKNIEHSVSAYYQADSGIEDALYSMSGQTNLSFENHNILSWNRDYGIDMFASWMILPRNWEWNSEFDNDFNIIRIWEPIQIEIWKGQNATYSNMNFKFYFKIPDITLNNEVLSWSVNNKIINWQISWENDILNASWSQISVTEIDWSEINFSSRKWVKLNNNAKDFSDFYNENCIEVGSGCILKMSVINRIEWYTNWNDTIFPYLEWKIISDKSIPLRYRIIKTTWKSYGFRKNLEVKVPQQTVNEAFDFTVFQ